MKSYCRWGRFKGAYKQGEDWYIPKLAALELKECLEKHISPTEPRGKPKVSRVVLPAVESENVSSGMSALRLRPRCSNCRRRMSYAHAEKEVS